MPNVLEQLNTALSEAIRSKFTFLDAVVDFDEIAHGGNIKDPAVYVDFEDIDPGQDDGTEREAFDVTISLYYIQGKHDSPVGVHAMAAALMRFIRRNTWGLNLVNESPVCLMPTGISSSAAGFADDKPGMTARAVTFTQTVYIGDDIWNGGTFPTEVYLARSPEIGTDHENDYEAL